MKEPTRIFLELLEHDVIHHSDDLAKRARAVLPKDVLASMSQDQHRALVATMREGMEFAITSFLAHFDNVGSQLPDEVLGFSIIAHITGTGEKLDIREGGDDYAEMWQTYILDRR